MKVLFDTNFVLDFLLDRNPFAATATRLVARVERRELEGLLGATTLTTIHYIFARALGKQAAIEAVRDLLALFSVAAVDGRTLALAADLAFPDLGRRPPRSRPPGRSPRDRHPQRRRLQRRDPRHRLAGGSGGGSGGRGNQRDRRRREQRKLNPVSGWEGGRTGSPCMAALLAGSRQLIEIHDLYCSPRRRSRTILSTRASSWCRGSSIPLLMAMRLSRSIQQTLARP